MFILEILKVIFLGIVEGITEWLPISSTGHMILVDEFIHLNISEEFKNLFLVVIQLGAILAVVVLFWKKLWPFHTKKTKEEPFFKTDSGIGNLCNNYVYMDKIILWLKIAFACIPAAVLGIAFDEQIDAMLTGNLRGYVVAATLIIYGIFFIIIESVSKKERFKDVNDLSFKIAFIVGLIQCLALIPGTSRSGSTILGAMLIGVSRLAATEFSFFLSIPAMAGGSLIKVLKFFGDGNTVTGQEWTLLIVGTLVSFIISWVAIKFLMSYIKKNDFKAFGYYRIILGIIVLTYFLIRAFA